MLKGKQGLSLQQQLMNGEDHSWTADEAIARSKTLKPLFEPGRSKKTHYSDTNYQLLGKIIEQITGKTIEENYHERLFKPLGLSHTYLYTDITDVRPQHLYYKNIP
jgi:CubicO group peptidase (beta-lactamase class C family)